MSLDNNYESLSDETVGFHYEQGKASQLIVVTFEDAAQAESLYEELVKLNKQKVISLKDAVFVTKNDAGELSVDEKVHHEKRSGTLGGAFAGSLIGLALGGPILGLAGGAIIGRLAAKKVDLGVDKGTIQSVSDSLDAGHTALFIYGNAQHTSTIIEAFKHVNGQIISTTLDTDAQEQLQKALDAENE